MTYLFLAAVLGTFAALILGRGTPGRAAPEDEAPLFEGLLAELFAEEPEVTGAAGAGQELEMPLAA
jgi:hypothetical protein